MSESTKTAEVVEVKAPAVEKAPVTRVKADSRGYAFFKKLTSAPDFSALKTVEFRGEAGSAIQEIVFNGEQDAGNMLRKGYINIGPNAEADVEVTKDRMLITPVVE